MSHHMTDLAMKQRGLKPATKIVLYWLADHHNEETDLCFPSLNTLAAECEMNKTTLIRHLDALEELGLIVRERRDRGNGSSASTSYRLTLTPVAKRNNPSRKTQPPPSCETQPPLVAKRNHPSCKTQQALVAKRNTHTNPGSINPGIEPTPPTPRDAGGVRDGDAFQGDLLPVPPSDAKPPKKKRQPSVAGGLREGCLTLDDEFERVWAHHPRKVGKGAARKAWAKARSWATYEEITGPLGVWIRLQRTTPMHKIAHFSTWLNQERWFDDQTHAINRAETTSDRLDRLGAISTEAEGDHLIRPTRTFPEIELRID